VPQLIIEQPGVPAITVPITDGEAHLGRAEDNTVALVADEVSRHHAKIVTRGGRLLLVDLNSLNGTYVNRQRVAERVLSHMDEVWLGSKCRVVFRDDTNLAKQAEEDDARDSAIMQDLARIRAEMEEVTSSATLMNAPPSAVGKAAVDGQTQVHHADLQVMGRALRRLDALNRASKVIASDFDLDKRLAAVLDTAIEVMGAERGFVMLRDDDSCGLVVKVAREMGHDLRASSPSMGIAGCAAIDGEPVLMGDSEQDDQFGGRESIIRQRIASAMCVPLRVEDRVFGSVYVDSRVRAHAFNKEDLELFASMALQSAMAIDNVRLAEQMVESEKKRADLGRFLSPAIVDEIMKEGTTLELGGRKRVVTTMFCDIRGFTPIAERIPPTDLVDMLNEHFTAMTQIVFDMKGTLDKFIGDELMAVFGSPLSAEDDAERAVRAALAMQAKHAELNELRASEGRPTFELGIGIATGDVIAGYVGAPERMEFTVVGDPVNTARRFCSLAEPGQICTGESTYAKIKDIATVREIGSVRLKGKGAPVQAYEVESVKG
jgi:adenylate cyclase